MKPTKGIDNKCRPMCSTLKEKGLKLFRGIFGNNNKEAERYDCLHNRLMKKLWPTIMKNTKYKHCF